MNEQELKDRLQAISKERGINFNECWKKLLPERFLSRLSRSTYTQQFIFKGGFLLAYIMEKGIVVLPPISVDVNLSQKNGFVL